MAPKPSHPNPRLLRLLGGDALANLRKRLRQRYERGDDAFAIRFTGLTDAERSALAGLLGRPLRLASSMKLDSASLDAALRNAGIADSLRDALEQLDGPVVNHAALHTALQRQWHQLSASCADPRLVTLMAEPNGLRLLKRLSRNNPDIGANLIDAAQAVLHHLPAQGITRSQLAAKALGDAHALDLGKPEATLVLAALRLWLKATAAPPDNAELDAQTNGAAEESILTVEVDESTRTIWAGAGVMVNELARPALFLNLPRSDTQNRIQKSGEPCYISLRELLRSPPRWDVAGSDIYLCENPNIVAIAADMLGSRCRALVCTEGMPAAAQRTLLLQLAQSGASLHYHGDFDWPGIRIGNWVMRACGAQPWRFGSVEYLAAISEICVAGRNLGAARIQADWDAALATAMESHGRAIDEEAVVNGLLQDLDAAAEVNG